MARRAIIKDLPPLSELLKAYQALLPGRSRQQALTMAIRNIALSLQQDEPLIFYSIREIASGLSAPLRTTALAYEALDMEGLLHRMRGSYTLLLGKQAATRRPVNGVVGLPIWHTAMVTSPLEAVYQREMDEQLRSYGFVVDSIFFHTGEECEPNFATRLLRHHLDTLIWHSPHPLSSHVLLSLREHGVRLVLIQAQESRLSIPARTHLCDWQTAYHEMAANWRASGIMRVIIPRTTYLPSQRAIKGLLPILEAFGLETALIEPEQKALAEFFKDSDPQKSKTDALAFVDLSTADKLCNGYPDSIEKIAMHTRLAFCRGPVRIPRLATKRIRVDVVQLDPVSLVRSVVEDLRDPEQTHEGPRHTFAAKYSPQIIMHSPLVPPPVP